MHALPMSTSKQSFGQSIEAKHSASIVTVPALAGSCQVIKETCTTPCHVTWHTCADPGVQVTMHCNAGCLCSDDVECVTTAETASIWCRDCGATSITATQANPPAGATCAT
jgi:hypothetical protein